MEKNWALSVDQCQLRVWQFSMHLTDLLSTLLRCNGFTRIQKAVVAPMGNRPTDSDPDCFFDAILALGSALELLLSRPLSWSSLVVVYNLLFVAGHNPIKKWFVVM